MTPRDALSTRVLQSDGEGTENELRECGERKYKELTRKGEETERGRGNGEGTGNFWV